MKNKSQNSTTAFSEEFLGLSGALAAAPQLLQTVRDFFLKYRSVSGDPISMTEVTSISQVSPITVVSDDLAALPELPTILQGALNVYTAYYLQAIGLLSISLKNVRILGILDSLNPNRNLSTMLQSMEARSDDHFTQEPGSLNPYSLFPEKRFPEQLHPSFESGGETLSAKKVDYLDKLPFVVGKAIEVKFENNCTSKDGKKSCEEVAVPVIVKLDTIQLNRDVISSIVSMNESDITFGRRFRDALSGRIHFIKDFIFCSDLISQSKKTMSSDPTGTYTRIMSRINNSRLISMFSKTPSLNAASAIFVLSEESERMMERKLGDGLSNSRVRATVFKNTSAMMIMVVDREHRRVVTYVRNAEGYTDNSFGDFKFQSEKDSSSTIMEVVKAFTLGNPPSF